MPSDMTIIHTRQNSASSNSSSDSGSNTDSDNNQTFQTTSKENLFVKAPSDKVWNRCKNSQRAMVHMLSTYSHTQTGIHLKVFFEDMDLLCSSFTGPSTTKPLVNIDSFYQYAVHYVPAISNTKAFDMLGPSSCSVSVKDLQKELRFEWEHRPFSSTQALRQLAKQLDIRVGGLIEILEPNLPLEWEFKPEQSTLLKNLISKEHLRKFKGILSQFLEYNNIAIFTDLATLLGLNVDELVTQIQNIGPLIPSTPEFQALAERHTASSANELLKQCQLKLACEWLLKYKLDVTITSNKKIFLDHPKNATVSWEELVTNLTLKTASGDLFAPKYRKALELAEKCFHANFPSYTPISNLTDDDEEYVKEGYIRNAMEQFALKCAENTIKFIQDTAPKLYAELWGGALLPAFEEAIKPIQKQFRAIDAGSDAKLLAQHAATIKTLSAQLSSEKKPHHTELADLKNQKRLLQEKINHLKNAITKEKTNTLLKFQLGQYAIRFSLTEHPLMATVCLHGIQDNHGRSIMPDILAYPNKLKAFEVFLRYIYAPHQVHARTGATTVSKIDAQKTAGVTPFYYKYATNIGESTVKARLTIVEGEYPTPPTPEKNKQVPQHHDFPSEQKSGSATQANDIILVNGSDNGQRQVYEHQPETSAKHLSTNACESKPDTHRTNADIRSIHAMISERTPSAKRNGTEMCSTGHSPEPCFTSDQNLDLGITSAAIVFRMGLFRTRMLRCNDPENAKALGQGVLVLADTLLATIEQKERGAALS